MVKKFIYVIFIGSVFASALHAKHFAFGKRVFHRWCGLTLGLDPYESYASVYYNVRKNPPPGFKYGNELDFYWKLFLHSLIPYYFLLQATDNPLTHGTAAFKMNYPDTYRQLDWDLTITELNILEMLASGYEEPYAFSFFLGYLTPFWENDPEGRRRQVGSASSGFIISVGNRHVQDLKFIRDTWWEAKWSLKGEKGTKTRYFKWNLELGGKFHTNDEVMDAVFYRFYRDHFNIKKNRFSLVRNASLEYKGQVPLQPLSDIIHIPDFFSMQYLDIGKKFPSKKFKDIAYTVNFGIYWKRYDETAAGTVAEDDLSFFVRPNVIF